MKNKKRWNIQKIQEFQKNLLEWYQKNARKLPWREDQNPYRVWVSEIMLQQTRVETVIPYFLAFMEEFPTVESLAKASEEKLLKKWEGLGYYSRARNLQIAAVQVFENYGGVFPGDPAEILRLKGIGPYTAGAIASISFSLPTPAVDGNVYRVMSRLFEITDDIAKSSTRHVFEDIVEQVISPEFPGEFNQAIMDIGSGICTPTSPLCFDCPIQSFCGAYANATVLSYPVKSKKTKQKTLYYAAYAQKNESGEYFLRKRAKTELLADLWMFPVEEISKKEYEFLQQSEESFGKVVHLFSHQKWNVLLLKKQETLFQVAEEAEPNSLCAWVKPEEFDSYTFSTLQKKLVKILN